MDFELECVSATGDRFAKLAGRHADEFALSPGQQDWDGVFPAENWVRMRRSGLLGACVPEDLGGLGVTSIHDLVVAMTRLGRGDGSTAIGVAMHTTALWYFARLRRGAPGTIDAGLTRGLELFLRACARGRVVACVAISERGTSLGRPRTTATTAPDGYRLDGRKSFCTNSPAATVFLTSVRMPGADGPDQLGFALVPRESPGLRVLQNWDAMGMRGSGSGDVVFEDCAVRAPFIIAGGPVGQLSAAVFSLTLVGALALAGVFLGMAEQAQATVVDQVTRAARAGEAAIQAQVAENEIDLACGRALMQRAAWLLERRLDTGAPDLERAEFNGLMREVQCAATATKRAAIAVVDRALTISGGGGYLNAHALSRHYRDVRAGPFMQPFSALEVGEYIGRVRLGLAPRSDDPGQGN
jgi:alkylation response protein AidB-like acyl-CoA dehydrogenase